MERLHRSHTVLDDALMHFKTVGVKRMDTAKIKILEYATTYWKDGTLIAACMGRQMGKSTGAGYLAGYLTKRKGERVLYFGAHNSVNLNVCVAMNEGYVAGFRFRWMGKLVLRYRRFRKQPFTDRVMYATVSAFEHGILAPFTPTAVIIDDTDIVADGTLDTLLAMYLGKGVKVMLLGAGGTKSSRWYRAYKDAIHKWNFPCMLKGIDKSMYNDDYWAVYMDAKFIDTNSKRDGVA